MELGRALKKTWAARANFDGVVATVRRQPDLEYLVIVEKDNQKMLERVVDAWEDAISMISSLKCPVPPVWFEIPWVKL